MRAIGSGDHGLQEERGNVVWDSGVCSQERDPLLREVGALSQERKAGEEREPRGAM